MGLAVLGLAVEVLAVLVLVPAVAVARSGRVSRSGWTSRCFERRVTAVSFPRKNRIVTNSYVFYSRAVIVRVVCFALVVRSFVRSFVALARADLAFGRVRFGLVLVLL